MDAGPVEAVRAVLARFQQGYSQRDLNALDAFMELFDPDAALEVIGTGATTPQAGGEWCLGLAAVRTLVYNDWKYWGDLELDVAGARIRVRGEVAWLATSGVVRDHISADECYHNFADYIRWVNEQKDMDERARLLGIVREGANMLVEAQRGENFTWPIRFAAVLVLQGEHWRFQQMHFSFPTTTYPDQRVE